MLFEVAIFLLISSTALGFYVLAGVIGVLAFLGFIINAGVVVYLTTVMFDPESRPGPTKKQVIALFIFGAAGLLLAAPYFLQMH